MNTLTWYAKAGVETPVVTCERHRLEEYHRRVAAGFHIAGSNRNTADSCDICQPWKLILKGCHCVRDCCRELT